MPQHFNTCIKFVFHASHTCRSVQRECILLLKDCSSTSSTGMVWHKYWTSDSPSPPGRSSPLILALTNALQHRFCTLFCPKAGFAGVKNMHYPFKAWKGISGWASQNVALVWTQTHPGKSPGGFLCAHTTEVNLGYFNSGRTYIWLHLLTTGGKS